MLFSLLLLLILTVFFIFLSAFFSGMETGFISASRIKMKRHFSTGDEKGRLFYEYDRNKEKFLTTTLIGNNIAIVAVTIIFGELVTAVSDRVDLPFTESQTIFIATGFVLSPIMTVFAEVVPKLLFRYYSYTLMLAFMGPFHFFYIIFTPFIKVFNAPVKSLRKFFKTSTEESGEISRMDIEILARESAEQGVFTSYDTELLERAMRFDNSMVKDIMIPMHRVISVYDTDTVETARILIAKYGYSRLPILDKRGEPSGLFDYKKAMSALDSARVTEYREPFVILREDQYLDYAMTIFLNSSRLFGFVYSSSGNLKGIITYENLVEKIIGEIDDEFD